MSEIKPLQVRLVAALPGTLAALTIYMVKANGGSTVQMYVTSETGTIVSYSVVSANGIASSNATVTNIIKLTQAAYDGITPDATTLYIIVG